MMICRDCPNIIPERTDLHPNIPVFLCPLCKEIIKRRKRKDRAARRRRSRGVSVRSMGGSTDQEKLNRMREKVSQIKRDTPCMDCGGKFHHSAMDFDHKPGEKKIAKISSMTSWMGVVKEMKKCDIVCSNCHRKRTWDRNKNEAM